MFSFTRLQLYKEIENTKPSSPVEFLKSFVLNKLDLSECPPAVEKDLYNCIHCFLNKLAQKKSKLRKSYTEFIKKSKSWLDKEFIIPESLLSFSTNTINTGRPIVSKKSGRPHISFHDASERTKRRKCSELLSSHSLEEIASTTAMGLRTAGKRKVANLVSEIVSSESIPKQPEKRQYSNDQALAMIIEGKFTTSQYNLIRLQTKEMGCDIYPSYKCVVEAKKRCYPDTIEIMDDRAEVSLQSLLNHTASRLIQICDPVSISLDTSKHLELIVKWGFDGSSGQSRYKQNTSTASKISDENFFATWLVPLQLRSQDENTFVLWTNPHPSSVRYCRPLRFQFLKETTAVIKSEEKYVTSQINQLMPLKLTEPSEITIHFNLMLTMADGKVWNALTDTSSMTCYICKAKPTELKKFDPSTHRINESALSFGISPLHCLIRCFEFLLHLSYRIIVKEWRIVGKLKEEFQKQKQYIQEQVHQRLGLIVDVPKQGYGNTNDGNSARRFFENPALVSEITGVDENLIYRLSILLKVISLGLEIDSTKFGKYCQETAELYRKLYEWYPMPPTIHKLLDHGEIIVSTAILPLGLLSEEAQEARNKDCRYFREHNTRKCSRLATNEDLFKRLLISSDPYITSLKKRQLPSKKYKPLSKDVLNLLKLDAFNQEELSS
jgi:hypothetical protein